MDYLLNTSVLETYEIGAALAAVLAYPPGVGDDEKCGRAHTVLCAEALRARYDWDEEWANKPQRIKPIYAFHPLGAVKRDMRTIGRQLQNRLYAAHVALAFIKEAESGVRPLDFPKKAKRLSVNELVRTLKFFEDEEKVIDADNFETRIWRPSLPVIHLAAAFAVNMTAAEKEEKQTSLGDLISDQGIIADIIARAELYEGLLLKSKLQINQNNLVRVRLASS